jgi:hypothetical protein
MRNAECRKWQASVRSSGAIANRAIAPERKKSRPDVSGRLVKKGRARYALTRRFP